MWNPSTVRVKLWEAGVPTPLVAVMVMGKVPVAVGVPDSSPPVLRVTPPGSGPVSEKVGAGLPVAVTVKLPDTPVVKEVALAEVMVGATPEELTVRVKLWVVGVPTPLLALMVIG